MELNEDEEKGGQQIQRIPLDISLSIIAEELSKIRQLKEMEFKQRMRDANKYVGMMDKFFGQQK